MTSPGTVPPIQRSLLAAVVALSVGLAACAPDALAPTEQARTPVLLQPSLIPSAADADALPIQRIRTVTVRDPDGAVLGESSEDVDPNADEWVLDLSVATPGPVVAVIYLYLIHVTQDGTELVQFSGRTDPLSLVPGEPITPDVPLIRGPLSNFGVTSVQITSVPALLLIGESAGIAATATTDGPAAEVFWTSTDPAVLEVDGSSVEALTAGQVRLIASAGAFADTAVVDVRPTDTIPPMVVATIPSDGAVGASAGAPISVTFDEAIDPQSVDAASFTLRDSLGVQVPATVTVAGSVATLTPGSVLDTMALYTADLAAGVRDETGNARTTAFRWSFETGAGATLLTSFDTGRGQLVAIARDPGSGNLYVHDDFSAVINVFTAAGVQTTDSITRPGPSSNDIDIDVLTIAATLGTTALPAGTVLVFNGETPPGTIYGIDPDTGVVLDSLTVQSVNQPVGGAHHPQRGTFYSVRWDVDLIDEIDMTSGAVLNTFPVAAPNAPASWDVFYGDIDVNAITGNLYIVSDAQASIRILSPTGEWIEDIDLLPTGVTGMSGVALDPSTSSAWVSSRNGFVYQVGGVN